MIRKMLSEESRPKLPHPYPSPEWRGERAGAPHRHRQGLPPFEPTILFDKQNPHESSWGSFLCLLEKSKSFHRLVDPILTQFCRDKICMGDELFAVTHRNAHAGGMEHRQVVQTVADGVGL